MRLRLRLGGVRAERFDVGSQRVSPFGDKTSLFVDWIRDDLDKRVARVVCRVRELRRFRDDRAERFARRELDATRDVEIPTL